MPVDPFNALNAMLRAEAARNSPAAAQALRAAADEMTRKAVESAAADAADAGDSADEAFRERSSASGRQSRD